MCLSGGFWKNQISVPAACSHHRCTTKQLKPWLDGAWPDRPHGIRCGSGGAPPSGDAFGRCQWSSSSWPWRTSCLECKKAHTNWVLKTCAGGGTERIKTQTSVIQSILTGTQLGRWVSALGALGLLDVVRRASATTAQRVRLITALSKAWCSLRLFKTKGKAHRFRLNDHSPLTGHTQHNLQAAISEAPNSD